MLLDVRFLLEMLGAAAWTWTMEACERLLAHLGLRESEAARGRRDFRAPSGLMASVHIGADGSPTSIEFPFEVPLPIRTDPQDVARFVDLTARPVNAILGEPTAANGASGGSRCWILPAARIAVERSSGDTVSLIVAR